jgi:alkylhydroperoxidase/carboxymuconolactone decarboxylase family protein
MNNVCYDKNQVDGFSDIGEFVLEQEKSLIDFLSHAVSHSALTEREKALIALSVAMTQHCPYCIDAYTNKCLALGISNDEMMESIQVGAAIISGVAIAHSAQFVNL